MGAGIAHSNILSDLRPHNDYRQRNSVMKTFKIVATAIAASISTFAIAPGFAQSNAASTGLGHYEWRQSPQSGPRAPLQGARRVWVPDAKQLASCDCDMMKMSGTAAASCMKAMPGMASPSGASAS
jgi:hypothetical protein